MFRGDIPELFDWETLDMSLGACHHLTRITLTFKVLPKPFYFEAGVEEVIAFARNKLPQLNRRLGNTVKFSEWQAYFCSVLQADLMQCFYRIADEEESKELLLGTDFDEDNLWPY